MEHNPQNEEQNAGDGQDKTPAEPVDASPESASPATPEQPVSPPTPAHEEVDRAAPQSDDNPETDTDGANETQSE